MFNHEILKEIAAGWGIRRPEVRQEREISGSPERSIFRTVITSGEESYVLENIPPSAANHRAHVASALETLRGRGLTAALSYLPDAAGNHVAEHHGALWQLSPFVEGVPLPRPAYVFEQWRGKAMGDFVSRLARVSRDLPFPGRSAPFSITKYMDTLQETIRQRRPELYRALAPIRAHLSRHFLPAHPTLPATFCHGDFHPLNIIWGEGEIRSVIDWEFAGYKPELYDVANLVGCIGVEAPESLTGDLVRQFIGQLKIEGLFSKESWSALHGLIVALRFAWLSEWLRKSDEEMITLELTYMNLLIEHRDTLEQAWDF